VIVILVADPRREDDRRMTSSLAASGVRLLALLAVVLVSQAGGAGAAASPAPPAPPVELCTRTLVAGRASAVWVEPCRRPLAFVP
jgi:hypothetical protein